MSALYKSYEKNDFKSGANDNDFDAATGSFEDTAVSEHASLTSPFKRGLDVLVSSVALIFALPVMMFVALSIYIQDGGKILFVQKRIGLNGEEFKCLKFRTMVADAEARLNDVLEYDADARREWETMRKLTVDPRITGLGRFLRKSSLDELPQFFNVLFGDMSLVGPRPIVTAEIIKYRDDFKSYAAVRPGISGLWQVSGRSDVDFERRVELDKQYAEEWSFWFDIEIMLRTIPALFARSGAR